MSNSFILSSTGYSPTFAAISALAPNDQVRTAVRMSLGTVSFASVTSRDRVAPHGVLFGGYGFQMERLNANAIPAKMVDSEALRDAPKDHFVDEAMGVDKANGAVGTASNSELAISTALSFSTPVYTSTKKRMNRAIKLDQSPKSKVGCDRWPAHCHSNSIGYAPVTVKEKSCE